MLTNGSGTYYIRGLDKNRPSIATFFAFIDGEIFHVVTDATTAEAFLDELRHAEPLKTEGLFEYLDRADAEFFAQWVTKKG